MEKYEEFTLMSQKVFALPLPKILRALLDYLEYTIMKNQKKQNSLQMEIKRKQKQFISHELIETLKWMTSQEVIKYYLKICKDTEDLSCGKFINILQIRYFQREAEVKLDSWKKFKKRSIIINQCGHCLYIISKEKNSYQICDLSYYLYKNMNDGIIIKSIDKRVCKKVKEVYIKLPSFQLESITNVIDFLQSKQVQTILKSDPLSKGVINSVKVKNQMNSNKENELFRQIDTELISLKASNVLGEKEQNIQTKQVTKEIKVYELKKETFQNYSLQFKEEEEMVYFKSEDFEFDGSSNGILQNYQKLDLFQENQNNIISLVLKYKSKLLRPRQFVFRRQVIKVNQNYFQIKETSCAGIEKQNLICGKIQNHIKMQKKQGKSFFMEGFIHMNNGGLITKHQNIKLIKQYLSIIIPLIMKSNSPAEKQNQRQTQRQQQAKEDLWKGEWKRDEKNGGMIYLNQEKINNQKKVISYILGNMAKNILQRKSILNIFSKSTNLQKLLYSLRYAPSLLENKTTSVDKIASSFSFCISMSLLYLEQEKVFNPILGQTSQVQIDGCPGYAQQISHHPPISSIFFEGRGYKIYGSLQSKAQLHLNSGTGCNAGPFTIEFDDGDKIINWLPPGQVEGISYGQRKFKLTHKSYHINIKQSLYLEVTYNKNSKGYFSFGEKLPQDYFEAKVYKMKKQFIQKFMNKKNPKITQNYIIQTVAEINGIWNQQIFVNNQCVINFKERVPSPFKKLEKLLDSDSSFRRDLQYRIQNNFQQAQKQKQLLEQRQRKDKKLRK